MAMVSRAKRRRGLEEAAGDQGEERRLDHISRLPDGVLSDIVSLLPTDDGARTQVLSSRWRHIWRSAPLNIDLNSDPNARFLTTHKISQIISGALSAHPGPVRRFAVLGRYLTYGDFPATNLDGWLQSPALDGLHELEFDYCCYDGDGRDFMVPCLPASVRRFSPTLQVASFGGCSLDGNNASGLQFPVLRQLSLSDVTLSMSSLHPLLAACPALQSLLLCGSMGYYSRVRIACPTLRSSSVHTNSAFSLEQLIIEDAPSLERLHCFDSFYPCGKGITISVISAPRLLVLGPLTAHRPRLEFGTTTVLQGSRIVSFKVVVPSVKVLSLAIEHLCLDVLIGFMKIFPCLEQLYIKIKMACGQNVLCRYKDLIGNLDIRLKKIVLEGYEGTMSQIYFAKFFVLNARMLESMRLHLVIAHPSNAWIDKQHGLLETKNKASRDMQLDFASGLIPSSSFFFSGNVHDLSTVDPFSGLIPSDDQNNPLP